MGRRRRFQVILKFIGKSKWVRIAQKTWRGDSKLSRCQTEIVADLRTRGEGASADNVETAGPGNRLLRSDT